MTFGSLSIRILWEVVVLRRNLLREKDTDCTLKSDNGSRYKGNRVNRMGRPGFTTKYLLSNDTRFVTDS